MVSYKEVRFGNYLLRTSDKRIIKINEEYFEPNSRWDLLEGIPLAKAKEWLLVHGFKDDTFGNLTLKVEDGVWLTVSYLNHECTELRDVVLCDAELQHIKYIHQLQNLHFLASGGKELERIY